MYKIFRELHTDACVRLSQTFLDLLGAANAADRAGRPKFPGVATPGKHILGAGEIFAGVAGSRCVILGCEDIATEINARMLRAIPPPEQAFQL
jgi:hypothetical protein